MKPLEKSALFLLFIPFLCLNGFGQEKLEKESRLKSSEVPTKARRLVDNILNKKKLKWYLEEGLTEKSIEAKFILMNKKYSVEFDTDGNLQDIEIEVKWNTLTPIQKERIQQKLTTSCQRFAIRKVQEQYLAKDVIGLIKNNRWNDLNQIPSRHELVVKCKNTSLVKLVEYLFSDKGELISNSNIIFKNATHLEY